LSFKGFYLAETENIKNRLLLDRAPEGGGPNLFDTASNLTDDLGLDAEDLGQLGEES
jgi:hypothetical protein